MDNLRNKIVPFILRDEQGEYVNPKYIVTLGMGKKPRLEVVPFCPTDSEYQSKQFTPIFSPASIESD